MGTTIEKLNKLNQTKTAIKEALETPSNIMSEYAEWIKKYVANQPTKKVTNGICENAVALPVKEVGIDGNNEQETTKGYNLLKYDIDIIKKLNTSGTWNGNTFTYKDVSITFNEDNTIYIKGTPSETFSIILNQDEISLLGNYVLGLKNNQVGLGFYLQNNNTSIIYIGVSNTITEKSVSFSESQILNKCVFQITQGYVLDITVFPVLYSGTSIPKYEPYTGGKPSPNTEYKQEIEVIDGVNRFNKNGVLESGYLNSTNGTVINGSDWKVTDYIRIPDNAKMLTILGGKGKSETHCFYDEDKKYISSIGMGTNTSTKITLKDNYKYIRATVKSADYDNFMIAFGDYDTYLPYGHIGLEHTNADKSIVKLYPINLNGNTIGKVGDIKDKLRIYRSGKVELDKKIYNMQLKGTSEDGAWVQESTTSQGYRYYLRPLDNSSYNAISGKNVKNIISNSFQSKTSIETWAGNEGISASGYIQIYMSEYKSNKTLTEFLSFIATVLPKIHYILATPQIIQLDSIEPIEMWEGTNNFKLITNLDTTFEVEYVVDKNTILDDVQTALLDAEPEI